MLEHIQGPNNEKYEESFSFMFGDNLKQQKLFFRWMDLSKVSSKVLSRPMCLVSYDKLTMFFPAVVIKDNDSCILKV